MSVIPSLIAPSLGCCTMLTESPEHPFSPSHKQSPCPVSGTQRVTFVGCPQGAGLAEPGEEHFFLGKTLSFVSFFSGTEAQSSQNQTINKVNGTPHHLGKRRRPA